MKTSETWRSDVCPRQDRCTEKYFLARSVVAEQVEKIKPKSPDRGGYRDRCKKVRQKGNRQTATSVSR